MAIDATADSNIYISALVFGGRPLRFLDAARAGICRLAISDALLDEILHVLRDKFEWPQEDLAWAATEIAAFTVRVEPTETIFGVVHDPDDHRVLECAIAGASQYIVTGDSDLLRLVQYRGVGIVRVTQFMGFLGS